MSGSDFEVVVVGGGAAGIAAARELGDAGVNALIVEARARLGGRAWTVATDAIFPVDLGCGWLHSADRNPWRAMAEAEGYTVDRTPPPWSRPALPRGSPSPAHAAFGEAIGSFREKLASFPEGEADRPASAFLEPHGRWNGLLDAVSTFYSGAELDRISTRDLSRYADSGVNWRVVEGYGTLVAGHGAGLAAKLGCSVQRVDRRGKRLRIDTTDGPIAADFVIVTLPTNLIAADEGLFLPGLPDKTAAAAGLPLGLADKLFLSLSGAEEFRDESRTFGRMDRTATGAYHFRPFGRPEIEAYFGGELARSLEAGGEAAFVDFADAELVGIFGSDFAGRVKPLAFHAWGSDPLAQGSYSYAIPGCADDRARLATPVDDRLFFAGEACSTTDYSTAHGAWLSGVEAAGQVIALRGGRRASAQT